MPSCSRRLGSNPWNGPNPTQHLFGQPQPKLTQISSRQPLRLLLSASSSLARDAVPPPSNHPFEYHPETCATVVQVLARPDSTCLRTYVDPQPNPSFLPQRYPYSLVPNLHANDETTDPCVCIFCIISPPSLLSQTISCTP